jgi:predicted restriction endonuclease
LHDKAFDYGLFTLDEHFCVVVSAELKRKKEALIQTTFLEIEGKSIEFPERFSPDPTFLERHRTEIFIDARGQQ